MPKTQATGFRHSLAELYRILPAHRRRQFVAVMLIMFATAVAELGTIGTIAPVLAEIAERPANGRASYLGAFSGLTIAGHRLPAAALLFAGFAIVAGALRLQLLWSTQRFTFGVGHELSTEIDRRILDQPYSFHIASHSSSLIAALEKVQLLVFNVLMPLLQMFAGIVVSVFLLIAMIFADATTAIVAVGGFGLIYFIIILLSRSRLASNAKVAGSAYDERIRIIQESLGGIRDIIIDGSEAVFVEAYRTIDERLMRSLSSNGLIAAIPRVLIETFGVGLVLLLALIAAGRPGGFLASLPLLGAIVLGCQRLLPYAQQIYGGWTTLAGNHVVVQQVIDLASLPAKSRTAELLPPLPFERSIRLRDVSFSYDNPPTRALQNVNIEIPKGSIVGLTGRSGSGKSTLADVVMGLLKPSEGEVTIDGEPLTERTNQRWWQSIAHVSQSPFISNDSIARNIAFGQPAGSIDMARVIHAAVTAELHEHIQSLPDGYSTTVGERGKTLSGGQQQRLGLARAIYKGAPLLVLDEPTSALDEQTEASILDAIENLRSAGNTVLLITHRPSALKRCTMVVTLADGCIA